MSRYIVTDIDQANSHLAHVLSVMCEIQFALEPGTHDPRMESLLWIARDMAEGIVAKRDADGAMAGPDGLDALINEHDVALAADSAREDNPPALSALLNETREAILNHRPTSLAEVDRKARYMAATRSFADWDDFDHAKLIHALTPQVAS